MFCCVASFSPACSDRKYRSRRSRNWAIKTPGKAERDTRLQRNAGAGNKGACWMEFRSFNQDGNRLDMPSLAVFFTVQTCTDRAICCKQWQVEQAQARQEKVQKERQRLEDAARQGLSDFKQRNGGARKVGKVLTKILRPTHSHVWERTFQTKFGRPQVFLAMIPKSPIMVISDRFVKKRLPHNHQPYRHTCLFVREDQATLKQLQLRLKLRQVEARRAWQLSASANSFDCWSKLNPKVF